MASIHFGFRECDLVDAAVPFMGDSISDGILATFLKQPGDKVDVDEPIAQVETEKVTIDVASPEAGVIQKFVVNEGDTVEPGTKISVISKSGEGVASPKKTSDETSSQPPATEKKIEKKPESTTWYSTFKNRLTKLIFVAFFTTTNLFVQNKCEAVRMEFVDDNISGPKLNI